MLMARGGLGRPSREKGSFFSSHLPLHTHRRSPRRVSAPSPLHSELGESRTPPPFPDLLPAPRTHCRAVRRKRPGSLGRAGPRSPRFPLGALRARPGYLRPPSELWPADSRPRRVRSPPPCLPLACSPFRARRGEGRGRGGMPPSPHLREGGGRTVAGARRRQPRLPLAPALRICRGSRRSCCRRLGCLGGRLRVT